MADHGDRPPRLCVGPCAPLRQGRRRLGWSEQSWNFNRRSPTTLTSSNNTDFGWTAGFGLEWAFWNNWSLRAEYDYIGLASQTFTVAPGPTTFGGDVITYGHRNISIMTAAVNYKFGGW